MAAIRWGGRTPLSEQLALGTDRSCAGRGCAPGRQGRNRLPLGWPVAFVDFCPASLARRHHGRVRVETSKLDGRLPTDAPDLAVARAGGPIPLSVSSDRIGASRDAGPQGCCPPWRCRARTKDRSGRARFVEVYPAAALRRWGYESRRYKGGLNTETRRTLVDRLLTRRRLGWSFRANTAPRVSKSDDVFDAVVAALNARAATAGGAVSSRLPGPDEISGAIIDGWIASESPVGRPGRS